MSGNPRAGAHTGMLYTSMAHPLTHSTHLALSVLGLLAFLQAAHAQGPLDRIPSDGQPWRIERFADVPPVLAAVLKQTDCQQSEAMMVTFPIELFRPAGAQPMAIAPCSGWRLFGRAYVFERDGSLRALAFPVMPFPGRVNASEQSGVLAWSPYAKTLTALESNDVCEGTVTRHTYRYDERHGGDDLNGFALVKVERGKLGCNGASENWQVMWEN
jgi:hypothetical protein